MLNELLIEKNNEEIIAMEKIINKINDLVEAVNLLEIKINEVYLYYRSHLKKLHRTDTIKEELDKIQEYFNNHILRFHKNN